MMMTPLTLSVLRRRLKWPWAPAETCETKDMHSSSRIPLPDCAEIVGFFSSFWVRSVGPPHVDKLALQCAGLHHDFDARHHIPGAELV